jgi:ABC-type molybdenum transport system ATPase subunit/photorepair protein PhrA
MNTTALLPRLQASFPNCQPLLEQSDTIRCERLYNDQPRSVYFFRATTSLPSEIELTRIHESIVSPSYFRTEGPARWSHYLVFVTQDANKNDALFQERKRNIEDNKSYARKFVVYDSELESFLDHSIVQPATAAPGSSVLDLWSDRLRAAGLEGIQSHDARAPLIRDIRSGRIQPSSEHHDEPAPAKDKQPASLPHLVALDVQKFGDRKFRGTFALGRVNLIRGANGSGKTSFLEAIEHFFCGATCRSGGAASPLVASVTYTTGKSSVYAARSNADYAERDLRWYGRTTTTRSHRLYDGFARFNFLNTDAAVHFSTDSDQRDLTELLSKIALGPAAAHTWTRIGQFIDDFTRELRPLATSQDQLTQSIGIAAARLVALRTVSPQAEALWTHARAALQPLDWPPIDMSVGAIDAKWFMQFQNLRSLIAASEAVGTMRSAEELRRSHADIARDVERVVTLEAQSRTASQRSADLKKKHIALQQRRERLERLRQYIHAEFPVVLQSKQRLTEQLAELSSALVPNADRSEFFQTSVELACGSKTLVDFEAAMKAILATERAELQTIERQRATLVHRLGETDAIIAEVRRLGRQYASLHPDAEDCPLCHTRMPMADLLSRIENVTDWAGQTSILESLTRRMAELSQHTRRLTSVLLTAERLSHLPTSAPGQSVTALVERMQFVQDSIASCEAQIAHLDSRLIGLQSSGFGSAEYSSLVTDALGTARSSTTNHVLSDAPALDVLFQELSSCESELEKEEGAHRTALARVVDEEAALASKYGSPVSAQLAAMLRTRSAALTAALGDIDALPPSVSRRLSTDLPSLLNLGAQALKSLDDLNSQLQTERARNKEIAVLEDQATRERKELDRVIEERRRLEAALGLLQDLQTHHSLESGLSGFLSANLGAIQQIFARIHVPHELRLSSLIDCKLTRTGSAGEVDLTQISTGQRAALMLSVFLTLNLSLRSGPPFMLIDDPIAHIDDLNALSFLDFLADIAESKQRQIFFATANEKLANIFQKKMEFLGQELKVHHMSPA